MKLQGLLRGIGLLFLAVLTGCTAVQPFPTGAKAGDTISLAVGSADGMRRDNTTVEYTPDDTGVPRDISSAIRAIVKLTPDKASSTYQASLAKYIPYYSGHETWLTVLFLDLPQDLTVGSGLLDITTAATYPSTDTHINDVRIPLEITGTGGAPNPFYFYMNGSGTPANLAGLEPLPNIEVQPVFENNTAYPLYGAAEIVIEIPGLESIPDYSVNIIPADMEGVTRSQTRMFWTRDGERITLFYASPSASMKYYEASSTIVLLNGYSFEGLDPVIHSTRFFDESGEEVTDTPVMEIVKN